MSGGTVTTAGLRTLPGCVIPPCVFPLLASQAAQSGWIDSLVASAFDPVWNLEHQGLIWAVIFVVLFVSGIGIPLPEDIPLTVAGFTTFKQSNDEFVFLHYLAAFAFVVVPILTGDLIAYHMGKKYGFGIRDRFRFLRSALSSKRIARVQSWFDSYGSFSVFMGRQVAGVRFVTFFTAGTMRVPLHKFVLFDFLGCLVSVPVWLTLGALASRYGQQWLHVAMRRVGAGFLLGSIAVFIIFLIIVKVRGMRARSSMAPGESR